MTKQQLQQGLLEGGECLLVPIKLFSVDQPLPFFLRNEPLDLVLSDKPEMWGLDVPFNHNNLRNLKQMENAFWMLQSPDLLKIVRMHFQPPRAAVCSHTGMWQWTHLCPRRECGSSFRPFLQPPRGLVESSMFLRKRQRCFGKEGHEATMSPSKGCFFGDVSFRKPCSIFPVSRRKKKNVVTLTLAQFKSNPHHTDRSHICLDKRVHK